MTSKNVKYYVWLDRPDDVQRKPVNLPFKFIFEFFPVILPFDICLLICLGLPRHYVPRNDRLLFSKLSFSYIHWLLI